LHALNELNILIEAKLILIDVIVFKLDENDILCHPAYLSRAKKVLSLLKKKESVKSLGYTNCN
jgi:hypothetical protein